MDDQYSAVMGQWQTDQLVTADAIAVAVYAKVPMADRVRMSVGQQVGLIVSGRHLAGEITVAVNDALQLRQSTATYLIPLAAIDVITGLSARHRPASGVAQSRRTMASLARSWAEGRPEVTLAIGPTQLRGRLLRVGLDHLDLDGALGPATIPLPALSWLRTRSDLLG